MAVQLHVTMGTSNLIFENKLFTDTCPTPGCGQLQSRPMTLMGRWRCARCKAEWGAPRCRATRDCAGFVVTLREPERSTQVRVCLACGLTPPPSMMEQMGFKKVAPGQFEVIVAVDGTPTKAHLSFEPTEDDVYTAQQIGEAIRAAVECGARFYHESMVVRDESDRKFAPKFSPPHATEEVAQNFVDNIAHARQLAEQLPSVNGPPPAMPANPTIAEMGHMVPAEVADRDFSVPMETHDLPPASPETIAAAREKIEALGGTLTPQGMPSPGTFAGEITNQDQMPDMP